MLFLVWELYKLTFFIQCFDCTAAKKQFEIISDTHELYFGNITEHNISEIFMCVTRP